MTVPLKCARGPTEIRYSSAIAHALAAASCTPAIDIANHIQAIVSTYTPEQLCAWAYPTLPAAVWQGVELQVLAGGWLEFMFTDLAIAGWLDFLVHHGSELSATIEPGHACLNPCLSHAQLFALQHAHARCCSLLRQAQQVNLIDLASTENRTWKWLRPNPIPWLTNEQRLVLGDQCDRTLIRQLFLSLDQFASWSHTAPNSGRVVQQATLLCDIFHALHRNHPLREEPRPPKISPSHSYLGVIVGTRCLLYHLLVAWLHQSAPTEL